ncbi:Glycoside hydrolase family 5 domain-containing protein [Comamonas aquatilis]|uniref:hypothetical protein n=1 Tax=Comamonas aquatilis TaxID=1778406 RepID=UPI0039EF4C88
MNKILKLAFAAWLSGLALLANAFNPNQPTVPEGTKVGAYLWGGMLNSGEGLDRFHRSVQFLLDQGFEAIRFTVSNNSIKELGLDKTQCNRETPMGCYLGQALNHPVFSDKRLKVLMVTFHENSARNVVVSGLDSASRKGISAELNDALRQLQTHFSGRPVKVVISNWEGDNMVYCGGVFQYIRSQKVASDCDTGDGKGLDRRLDNFVSWMKLRDSVVTEFRKSHPALDVQHAPEFNIADLVPSRCKVSCDENKTVFKALEREGRRPLCSFSSYNSTNRNALDQDLPRLLKTCDQVILGELGFAEDRMGSKRVQQGFSNAAAAVSQHPGKVPAMMIWNAFNEPGRTRNDSYGLFKEDGRPGNILNIPQSMRP